MRKVPQTPPLPNPPGMAGGLLAFASQLHRAAFAYLSELAALANQLVDRVTDGEFTTLTVTGAAALNTGLSVDGNQIVTADGQNVRAYYPDATHYGYFAGFNGTPTRGFFIGYGNGGTTVDFNLDAASKLEVTGGTVVIDVTNDDFIVRHSEGGATNVIWKSSSNDKLYLGTTQYPVRVRSSIETDSASNDIGSSTEPFDNVFMNQLNVLTFSETGASIGKRIESTFGSLDSSRDSTASVNHQRFYNPNGIVGTISTSASSTAYNTSSDYRLKVNYGPIPDALARVSAIPVYRGEFITNPGVLADYFIAHEVQPYVPEAVTGEKDAVDENGTPIYQGIDQGKLVPLHHAAIQALLARIEALEAQLEALTNA